MMQEEIRGIAGAVADMLRIMDAGRESGTGVAQDGAARRHAGPEGGAEDA